MNEKRTMFTQQTPAGQRQFKPANIAGFWCEHFEPANQPGREIYCQTHIVDDFGFLTPVSFGALAASLSN